MKKVKKNKTDLNQLNERRVGCYLRVSTEEQARIQEGSLVSQRKRLEEYVGHENRKNAGWGSIVEVYCDEGLSAKDMNRPEFQRLLNDVKHGRVNVVLATELSRLSRSNKDFANLWEFFKEHDTKIITLREGFGMAACARWGLKRTRQIPVHCLLMRLKPTM